MAVLRMTIKQAKGGRYDAHIDGRYLLTTRQPLLDGARALLAQGADPADTLEMWREGKPDWDMRAPIGKAAELTVCEADHRPYLAKWEPFKPSGVWPPISETLESGITAASST